jgi:mannosyl-3-phosphoglycerate phosphatase family protein
MKKLIIITDLDGTLLDASAYSFEAAMEALNLIKKMDIPLIICSSKTRTEIENYRLLLNNNDPFISENGGGIFMPEEHRDLIDCTNKISMEQNGKYFIIPLGTKYKKLRRGISKLRDTGFQIRGFGDMETDEIARITGLSLKEAAMSKERDFDEPFVFQGGENDVSNLIFASKRLGFNITRSKFFHLLGNSDKGRAISLLLDFYRKKFGDVYSVAIGDSPNDLPMLEGVDMPIVVQKTDGGYDPALNIQGLTRADGIGPAGWNKAIIKIIKESCTSL